MFVFVSEKLAGINSSTESTVTVTNPSFSFFKPYYEHNVTDKPETSFL